MKRTVKAWARILESGRLFGARSPDIYWDAYDFENERLGPKYDRIVPCTITYDDGTKPKRRKKPHA